MLIGPSIERTAGWSSRGLRPAPPAQKNEFQSLRPLCGAKRPVPQVLNVSDRLAFCIVPEVFPPALDLDKACFLATQLNIVTTFRDHDGRRSLTSHISTATKRTRRLGSESRGLRWIRLDAALAGLDDGFGSRLRLLWFRLLLQVSDPSTRPAAATTAPR